MRNYPTLEAPESTRDYQQEFGGYNHNIRINDYEFYDEKNMTGDYYPVLSPRNKRGHIQTVKKYADMICKDKLCKLIDNDEYTTQVDRHLKLYIGDTFIPQFTQDPASVYYEAAYDRYDEHKMISMGAYLVILYRPLYDHKCFYGGWYINTENLSDYGHLNASATSSSSGERYTPITNKVKFTPCTREGENYLYGEDQGGEKQYVHVGVEPPGTTAARNGIRWLDISKDKHYLKAWAKEQNMWTTINTTFIKIQAPDNSTPFTDFKKGDSVILNCEGGVSGWELDIDTDQSYSQEIIKYNQCHQQIEDILNKNTIIENIASDGSWIVVTGFLDRAVFLISGCSVTVKRQMPYMDYICENQNRIWGCRYGTNRNGDFVNEIYACAQGDFKNWFIYQGISTDSYAATVGSNEAFTGCAAFQSNVLFFKENFVHKLYGTMPSNYQIQEIKMRGVQKGSEKSLCLVNETLFYKSATDICYYSGSLPVSVSEPLGEIRYKNAIFGSIKSKLYACMQDDSNAWHLFTYDILKNIWHKEDNIHLIDIYRVDNDLYYVDSDGNIGTFTGAGTLEDDFEWYAETGPIGYTLADNKFIGRMTIRLSKPIESRLRLLIRYDEEDEWLTVSELYAQNGTKSFSLPIIPHRCDYFRLRFEGIGECKIFSLCKTIESGSDEYVY